ncbi:hypothetical protein SSX86_024121 [Deinandra increscens subsp. villosa]|uniref:Uncharacterized protein n=1 Tax=Deinandra increscens subsp. villosa TaxID=3103831 RepID=A0AAP0GNE0_9ASTR
MGTCASIPSYSRKNRTLLITNGSSPAKVIHSISGRLQEFRQPVKAGKVLSDSDFFLCNAEDMFVNCHVPHVPAEEDLRPGEIYFIMPAGRGYRPISLQELCSLAVKASVALQESRSDMKKETTAFGRRRSGRGFEKVDFQLALKKL